MGCWDFADFADSQAYHEMRILAARVFYSFDLELCPESKNWKEQLVFTLWEKVPLMCKLKAVS
jgi:hypothetical protein